MERGDTIGISNEIAADEAVLTLDQGRVLVVRSHGRRRIIRFLVKEKPHSIEKQNYLNSLISSMRE